jgi:hypothetical protein
MSDVSKAVAAKVLADGGADDAIERALWWTRRHVGSHAAAAAKVAERIAGGGIVDSFLVDALTKTAAYEQVAREIEFLVREKDGDEVRTSAARVEGVAYAVLGQRFWSSQSTSTAHNTIQTEIAAARSDAADEIF